jgi:glycosyltransferase involved in cell wall biosynthesis
MGKTALIINPYWTTAGGGERYSAALARLLLDSGWRVDLDWPDPDLLVRLKNQFAIDLSSCRLAYKAMTSGYDLTFWVSDGSLPASFSRKTIIHFQFPFQHIHGKSLLNRLKSKLYIFVTNSLFTKNFIDREFGIHSTVIYPPVDTDTFKPGKKTNTILYVGRFSQLAQKKGQEILIDTFNKFSSKIPGWKLIIAGGASIGVNPEHLSNLSRKSKSKKIDLIINPTVSDLKKLYSQAKIFWSGSGYGISEDVEPTRVEHFGISVVEAMSAGAVPIITEKGGHREIIESGKSGYFWSDPADLASATLKLISAPDQLKKMSANAVARSRLFKTENFNRAFVHLLTS